MNDNQSQRQRALDRRRNLRARSTKAESLLWQVLRSRRLCGLKFRRQHSIGPFIVDFACVEKRIAVELDGDYHDAVYEQDLSRQHVLEEGWQVIRFCNKDVIHDVEAVAIAIARELGLEPEFEKISAKKAPSPRPSPPN